MQKILSKQEGQIAEDHNSLSKKMKKEPKTWLKIRNFFFFKNFSFSINNENNFSKALKMPPKTQRPKAKHKETL